MVEESLFLLYRSFEILFRAKLRLTSNLIKFKLIFAS